MNIYKTSGILSYPFGWDSDDEDTDGGHEWPSAALDYARAMQGTIDDHEERQQVVAEWVAQGVATMY